MIDTVSLSYLLNGILTALTLISGFLIKKYKPELDTAKLKIDTLDNNLKLANSVLTQIKSLTNTCVESSDDGIITQEESKKILNEISVIANSEEVNSLLNLNL